MKSLVSVVLDLLRDKRVIGVQPKGETFTRGSFTFVRTGKIGSQAAWRVVKVKLE